MYKLMTIDNKLCLTLEDHPEFKPVCVDFNSSAIKHRLKQGGKENLIKACGLKKLINPTVIDATAGFGTDSFIMAAHGAKVTMLERQDFMLQLLEDGLNRAASIPETYAITKNMTLVAASALDFLSKIKDDSAKPDLIYLDPMFPDKKKTALAKKEMFILQKIIQQDIDTDELLILALKCAKHKVVVKRPLAAPHLNQQQPDFMIKGKAGRFDVYVTKT